MADLGPSQVSQAQKPPRTTPHKGGAGGAPVREFSVLRGWEAAKKPVVGEDVRGGGRREGIHNIEVTSERCIISSIVIVVISLVESTIVG